jgi:hypothetical protein
LGTTFGETLNDRVIVITSATVVLLVITDIWCPILFYVVYDLLNLYKREVEVNPSPLPSPLIVPIPQYYEKNNESMDSDDSELDEFNIRDDKNAIAKARRASRRHSKRRIRIESSDENDSESTESDSPKSHRQKPSRKHNRQSSKFSSVLQDSNVASNQQHITLEMALGSPADGPEDDDEDGQSENEKQDLETSIGNRRRSQQLVSSTDRNQFTSSRRIANQNLSPNQGAPSSPRGNDWSPPVGPFPQTMIRPTFGDQVHFPSPCPFSEFSPPPQVAVEDVMRGYPQQSPFPHVPPAMIMALPTEQYHGGYSNEVSVAIDDSTSISPDRFTELWESLDPLASFGSFLLPESTAPDQKLEQIVQHLHRNSFYVIAAGLVDSTATLYGFISGTKRILVPGMEPVDTSVYFFLELKVYLAVAVRGSTSGAAPAESWSFECVCKCTDPEVSPLFIQRMHLGDIFQQSHSPSLLSGPGGEG